MASIGQHSSKRFYFLLSQSFGREINFSEKAMRIYEGALTKRVRGK